MAANTATGSLKVFLSHPLNAPGNIKELLVGSGFQVQGWETITTGPLQRQLVRAISSCDALVVEIDHPHDLSPGTYVEVGIALGTQTPVVLLISEAHRGADLPSSLADFPIIWTGGGDNAAIARRAVDTVQTARRAKSAFASTHDVQSPSISPREYADQSERRVGRALERLKARVVPEGAGNQPGHADLTIWLDDLEPTLNPILVEVTGRLPHLPTARTRLQDYAAARGARLAMLVTPDDHEAEWTIEEFLAMLTIGVETLD